jgi:hypothetical protein
VSRSEDGKPLELFLNHHKHGNQVDTNARDAANALSFAPLPRADIESIRKALCCDSHGRALGPLDANANTSRPERSETNLLSALHFLGSQLR